MQPRVVILCGGRGTRLNEVTAQVPKPMVEIGGRPILWHIMKHYAHFGYDRFVLCLGYKGEEIRRYFLDYDVMHSDTLVELGDTPAVRLATQHAEAGWQIALVETGPDTATGGRVKRVESYVDSELILVTYGDGVSNIPIDQLVAFHRMHGKMATVTGVVPTSRYGTLAVEGERVTSFVEKPAEADGCVNGGFFVFDRRVLDYIEGDGTSLERAPLETLAREGQLMMYRHRGYWRCMDTYQEMLQLNDEWDAGRPEWVVWRH